VRVPHVQIECRTAEGVGRDHAWQVSVGDLSSSVLAANTS